MRTPSRGCVLDQWQVKQKCVLCELWVLCTLYVPEWLFEPHSLFLAPQLYHLGSSLESHWLALKHLPTASTTPGRSNAIASLSKLHLCHIHTGCKHPTDQLRPRQDEAAEYSLAAASV